MIERKGDLFDPAELVQARALVVPTNGTLKRGGAAVMGAGVALSAARTWPRLPVLLGQLLKQHGNRLHYLGAREPGEWFHPSDREEWAEVRAECLAPCAILAFPTKRHWEAPAEVELLARSTFELQLWARDNLGQTDRVLLPRVGCGLGGLDWARDVRPNLARMLDDRFHVLSPEGT